MNKQILIILFLIFSLNLFGQVEKKEYSDSAEVIEIFQKQDIFTVSEDLLEEYEISIKNPHTLQVISDGTLTYHPFGYFEDIKNFRKKYSYFKETEQITETDTLYVFSYKESFIKVYFHNHIEIVSDRVYGKEVVVCSGKIINKEIQLVENVRVGISKNDVLKKFFTDKKLSMYDFSNVDTLITVSSTYDYQQIYVFVNDTLKEIIIGDVGG